MRIVFLALMLLTGWPSYGSDAEELKLDAEILSQRYCDLDHELVALRLKFKTTLANNGHRTILVRPPFYPTVFVSRTPAELRKGTYEFELNGPDPRPELLKPSRQKRVISIEPKLLRPGDTIEFVLIVVGGSERVVETMVKTGHLALK
jgi:hypothetical protein